MVRIISTGLGAVNWVHLSINTSAFDEKRKFVLWCGTGALGPNTLNLRLDKELYLASLSLISKISLITPIYCTNCGDGETNHANCSPQRPGKQKTINLCYHFCYH